MNKYVKREHPQTQARSSLFCPSHFSGFIWDTQISLHSFLWQSSCQNSDERSSELIEMLIIWDCVTHLSRLRMCSHINKLFKHQQVIFCLFNAPCFASQATYFLRFLVEVVGALCSLWGRLQALLGAEKQSWIWGCCSDKTRRRSTWTFWLVFFTIFCHFID